MGGGIPLGMGIMILEGDDFVDLHQDVALHASVSIFVNCQRGGCVGDVEITDALDNIPLSNDLLHL